MGGIEAAVASGILNIVANKLAPLIIREYSYLVGVTKDLQDLQGLIKEINSCLETVGDQALRSNPSLNWLKRLKAVAYAVDDVVDEFQMKAEKHDAAVGSGIVSKYICRKPESFVFQCKAARKLKTIKKRFAAIVKQRTDFSAIANSLPTGNLFYYNNERTVEMQSLPIVDPASVLGRDREKHEVIYKLVKTDDQQNIKIVSIIGLGGSGKTTLAKLVFNDREIIKNHFEIRLWVHVSQEFDVQKLVGKLFEAFADDKSERHPLQHMVNKISDKLSAKRFLLVLDDVWTESQIQWEELMVYLKSSTPGSRILLTTRNSRVAETVGSTSLYDLPFLSSDASWKLFQQSFMISEEGWRSEYEEVGKEIVKKCGGVPLAIKVLAGVLHDKEQIEEWQAVRYSNLLEVEGEEQRLAACLRMSYFHLPSQLKQCFSICSVFPKGHTINKEQLIDQWIVHDMITQVNGVVSLEHVGHKYFNYLVQMSFLQDVYEKENGKVSCRMHDLVHDLARSILDDEISLIVPKEVTSTTKSYRYFSLIEQTRNLPHKKLFEKARLIYVEESDNIIAAKALKNARHLRSITMKSMYIEAVPLTILQIKNLKYLHISGNKIETLPEAISDVWSLEALHVTDCIYLVKIAESIGKLQKLRILNLSGCMKLKTIPDSVGDCKMLSSIELCYCYNFTVLPDSIGKNKNLRVLRLNNTLIEGLPSSVTTLGNLVYLDLWWCHVLVELPECIGNLKNLQVLNLESCNNLRVIPAGIGQLNQLRKLGTFIPGQGENSARISELRNVAGISGNLTIRGIQHVRGPGEARESGLKQMVKLQSLALEWERDEEDLVNIEMEQGVLDGLEPPSGITSLKIDGYAGGKYAEWMLKQISSGVRVLPRFPCLTAMKLSDFPNLRHLEGLVELPCLEELVLHKMPTLESISGGPFPSLVKLLMWDMPRLEAVWMVTERIEGDLVQLQIGCCLPHLSISGCPKLMVKPHFPSSMEYLELQRSNEKLLQSPGQGPSFSFSHLKKLVLTEMTGLGSGQGWELLQHMRALEFLEIYKIFDGLTELPGSMRSFTSLQALDIGSLSAMRMLPEWLGELQSLQEISIHMCMRLRSLPQSMGHLTALQVLRISWCDALKQLPECLGELCSLRILDIQHLVWLTCLPQSMCRLTSLEQLKLWQCPCINSLPKGMQVLIALQQLEIYDCPNLKRRCTRGHGVDWYLIAHIPYVRIS